MITPMKEPQLSIPPGLFRASRSMARYDRYVVYHLLNRMVTFTDPVNTHQKVSGYVEEVYRDIFTSEIRLKVQGRVFRFKEPDAIRENQKAMVFVYGDVKHQDVSDAELFDEMRKEQFKENVARTIHRLAPKKLSEIRFTLGAKKQARRKPFLMKGISASNLASVSQ